AHWQDGVQVNNTTGGSVIMDPSLPAGTQFGFTPLDYAALRDIGWEFGNDVPSPPVPPGMIPVTVKITHLHQIDNPDSSIFPFETDGDYYTKVWINGVEQPGVGAITDDDFDPGWSFTQNVDAKLASIPVHIEIWDEDDFLRFDD